MNSQNILTEELPIMLRLALSYAPASAREQTLALLALDTRLAAILRAAREPMLAQLRLTWWREQLKAEPSTWPQGDPLLAGLRSWGERREELVGLIDGWEGLTAPAPLPMEALSELAAARGEAFAALAEIVGASGDRDTARRLATNWALADLADHLSDPEEHSRAVALARDRDWRPAALSRRMRPLVVMHGLASRALRRHDAADGVAPKTMRTWLTALRLGLFGR